MKASRYVVFLFIVLWSVAGIFPPVRGEDIYHGRVVDEQTDKPLVGAAVTVIWFRSPILGLESTRDFNSAQETATDSEGKFSLSVSPGIDWNPFTYIRKEPQIVIYQPGYEPTWAGWRERNNYNSGVELAEALKKGTTIRLQPLKTEDQLRRFADLGAVAHTVVPHHAIPILVRVVNLQRKMAGIASLYAEPVHERKIK
jgi:hypothetical protein